ncbi:MAG: translation initiation factor [Synergistales bacterium]|nr:translation initiation factor [Synergistales bacterium]
MVKGKKLDLSSHEPLSDGQGLFQEAALSLGFSASPKPSGDVSPEPKIPQLGLDLSGQRAGLRIERKGRKGKTVTIIEGMTLDQDGLGLLAKELRKAMGCGSSVEGASVVLQGDNRERIGSWLREKGVRVNF